VGKFGLLMKARAESPMVEPNAQGIALYNQKGQRHQRETYASLQ